MKITDLPTGPYTPPKPLADQIVAAAIKGYRVTFRDSRPDHGEPPVLHVECRTWVDGKAFCNSAYFDPAEPCAIPLSDRLSMEIDRLVDSLARSRPNG